MQKSYWFYHPETKKRVLLLQHKIKKDADIAEQKKSMRDLGVKTVGELQSKKTSEAEILISDNCNMNGELIGVFENSFRLSNYQFSLKNEKMSEEDKKKIIEEDQQEVDQRKFRMSKKIDQYEITTSDQSYKMSEEYKFWISATKSTEIARDLANTRGSQATPCYMEEQVHKHLKESKNQQFIKEIKVIKGKQLEENGMNLFYNVGKGAQSEPRCVIINYQGNPDSQETEIALVGKGLTYDCGGLNLKPTGHMEDMFLDKSGACAVFGALLGSLEMGLKKNVVFAMGFAENAIGSKSYKPGDIIKSMKDLTVEIGNTDAEGRLVLADTMTYVQKYYKPKQMIDLATLTGAIMAALGTQTAGLFSNDDTLANQIILSGKQTFEPYWQMPITDEAKEDIKGQVGDITNSGKSRYGGSSQAAAFLMRFVEKDVKWVHLDIAGTAMMKGAKPPLCNDGTGFGTQTLLYYLFRNENKQ